MQEDKATLGPLPVWDLGDLYAGPDSPEIERDLAAAAKSAESFRTRYAGKLADLGGGELLEAVKAYEALSESLAKLASYAQLLYATDMTDGKTAQFQQTLHERVNDIATETLFFTLEINRIADAALAEKLQHGGLRRYLPWFDAIRALRPHQLPDAIERLLHEKQMTGHNAWQRLFDETLAEMRFAVDGQSLPIDAALNLLTNGDAAKRKAAAQSLADGLRAEERRFALVTNTLAKDKEIEDRWRKFPRPVSARNLANQVEDGVVDALVQAVRASYPQLSHRYYKLKAKWLGFEQLSYWDRNAPLPGGDDLLVPWVQARQIVLDAYHAFSPELAEHGRRFFENPWIDATVHPGKSPGAFAHPTVPSAHPYLLLNYHGRTRDVMTLAHELGHGVHQLLAAPQGHLLADTPLTLAETASVFGEMLTFQALLKAERAPKRKRALLAGKVEDMLNTVVRQIAMHSFEERLHDARKSGELTAQQIGDIWLATQREALGDGVRLDDDCGYRVYWSYIPHFIHTPFYVYAYAFGDCLVNSLYAVYQASTPGFAARYLDMLRAGGTRRHRELLQPFGLDAADPAFWSRGLSLISGFIDQLEAV